MLFSYYFCLMIEGSRTVYDLILIENVKGNNHMSWRAIGGYKKPRNCPVKGNNHMLWRAIRRYKTTLSSEGEKPQVKYGVRSAKFIWAPVYSCTHSLRPRNSPPPPSIWAHIRVHYWSAKKDSPPSPKRLRTRQNSHDSDRTFGSILTDRFRNYLL